MKFYLFDAMALMKKSFGNSGSIRLSNDTHGVFVTLEVYKDGVLYNSRFLIDSLHIATDSDVEICGMRFNRAVEELKDLTK